MSLPQEEYDLPSMTARERFQHVCRIFDEARELPDEPARRDFLIRGCGDDESLRLEVEAMLAAHESSSDPDSLEVLPAAAELIEAMEPPPTEVIPSEVGKYKIRRLLGSGSVGTVYEAEERNPHRRVALKFLSHEFASSEVHDRFRQEAEALAVVQHPGICQIYEMGTAPTARGSVAYLALELVEGRPLIEYANRKNLDLRERLALVADLADIVTHAHQRGVIHRDLKPHNVLVTEEGQPKVLDFGLARWTDDRTRAGLTHTGLVVGTLAYMSPEQASGLPDAVDTRTDVYALGVMAYELVTGKLPHPVDGKPVHEALSTICRTDPRPASSVTPKCPPDASVVIGTALERDRERRYQTAEAFAEDIRRFLNDEPIVARAPTPTYHLRKFVKRNKALVTGLSIAVLALTGGLVAALKFAQDANEYAAAAARNAATAHVHAAAFDVRERQRLGASMKLAAVEPDLRAWEWHYLHAHLDQAIEVTPLPVDPTTAEGARALWADPQHQALMRAMVPSGVARAEDGGAFDLRSDTTLEVEGAPLTWKKPGVLAGTDPLVIVGLGLQWPGRKTPAENGRSDIVLVDRASGKVIKHQTVHGGYQASAATTKDGRHVAVAYSVGVWEVDMETGKELYRRISMAAYHVAYSPNERFLAVGGSDMAVSIFDRTQDVPRRILTTNGGSIFSIAWSHDSRQVAAGTADGNVHVWDLETGTRQVLMGHDAEPRRIWFEPGNRRLHAVTKNAHRVWLLGDGLDVLRHHAPHSKERPFPFVYAVRYSPDGRRLVSGGWDRTLRVMDADTGRLQRTIESGQVRAIGFLPDGTVLAGGSGHLARWDLDRGQALARFAEPRVPQALATTPDGTSAFVLNYSGHAAHRVDPDTCDCTPILKDEPLYGGTDLAIAVAPDGRLGAIGGTSGKAVFFDTQTAKAGQALEIEGNAYTDSIAFHPTRPLVAIGLSTGIIQLHAVPSGRRLAELRGHTGRVFALAWSRDGQRLASGSRDKSIRLWDPDTRTSMLTLLGHGDYIHDLDWSLDGRTLVSASGDNTVRFWTTKTNQERWVEHQRPRND